MSTPLDLLGRAPYVLLTTYKRDGTAVSTPVWVVRDGDELLIWTNPDAGKVKRIRRDGHCEIGPCTMRGKPLGAPIPATASILEADRVAAVKPLLVRKYGWQARMTQLGDVFQRLLGRPAMPVGAVAIRLDD